jgi:hypothetical protein
MPYKHPVQPSTPSLSKCTYSGVSILAIVANVFLINLLLLLDLDLQAIRWNERSWNAIRPLDQTDI